MYFLSKLVSVLIQPLTFLLFLLVIAAWRKSWNAVRGILVVIVVLAIVPIGPYLLHHLERQYSVLTVKELLHMNPDDIAGGIILGGAIDLETSLPASGQPQLSNAVERFVEGVALANQFPDKPVIFTGGAASLNQPEMNEAAQIKILMQKLNIDPERFVFEDKSMNTFENMKELETKGYKAKGRWILVTSAYHMPRSVRLFESHGWSIIPYPTNYMEDDQFQWVTLPNILGNYMKLNIVVREMIAIMAYHYLGRIS